MRGFAFSNTLSSCHQPCFSAHLRNRRLLQSACSAFLAAMLLSLPVCIFGQVTSGTITGDVTDFSGAVVPNAGIVITDVDRGSRYSAASNPEGLFLKTQIPNGRYRVRVEAQGVRGL